MSLSVPKHPACFGDCIFLKRHRAAIRVFSYVGLSWLFLAILVAGYLGPLQQFAYLPGYVSNFAGENFALASLLVVGTAAVLPKRNDNACLFAWLVFFLFLVPIATVFSCSDRGVVLPLGSFAAFLVATGVVLGMPLPPERPRARREDRILGKGTVNVLLAVIIAFSVAMLLLTVATQGAPSLAALDLDKVYDIRAQSTMGSGMSALVQLAGLMLVPLAVTVFLCRGQRLAALAMTGLQMLLYLCTANKAWLLIVVLIWGLYLLTRFSIKPFSLLLLLTAGVAVATAVTWLFPERLLAAYSLLVRRLLLLPAILRFDYFSFFQDHPTVGLQGTLPGMLLPDERAYVEEDYQVQISQMTWGSVHSTHANTGLFGGEFANFGIGSFAVIALNLMIITAFFRLRPRNGQSRSLQAMLVVLAAFILLNISSVRFLFSSIGIGFVVASVLLFVCFDERAAHPAGRGGLASEKKRAFAAEMAGDASL